MHHIDLIGSFIIGGLLLLSVMGLMFYFNMNAHSNNVSQIEQRNTTEFGRVVEYDFNKIGYRVVAGDKIVAMDSTSITFRADLNNDGVTDSVRYTRTGSRPNFILTRHTSMKPGSDFPFAVGDFSLKAYTSSGQTTWNRADIRAIEIKMLIQKDVQLQQQVDQAGAYWTRRFYPKNL